MKANKITVYIIHQHNHEQSKMVQQFTTPKFITILKYSIHVWHIITRYILYIFSGIHVGIIHTLSGPGISSPSPSSVRVQLRPCTHSARPAPRHKSRLSREGWQVATELHPYC